MHSNQEIGKITELKASYFLQKNGLRLVTTNYQCRRGEIDLIMQDQYTLVFVEVRFRNNPYFGGAFASVDRKKQNRLRCAAQHYLLRYHSSKIPPCRFDVVGATTKNLVWLKDVF